MLNDLLTMTDENTSEKRFELMNAIADMLVTDGKRKSTSELELFSEVFITLLGKLDETSKAQISHRFATITNIPKQFATALATESAEIAAPMLKISTVFDDDDLINITNITTTEHRICIATRENITTPITDALIEHCEPPVFKSLVHNDTAHISLKGFSNMIEHSPDDCALLDLLLKRKDLPDEIKTLLPHLPDDIYQQVARVADNHQPEELSQLMDKTHDIVEDEQKAEAQITRSELNEVNEINNGTLSLDQAVIQFARADEPRKLAQVIAEIEQLNQMHLDYAMLLQNGEPITTLCRSIDLSEDAFLEICYMRATMLDLSPTARNRMIANFNNLDVNTAKRSIRHMNLKRIIKSETNYV
ncbi:MAG: DUF2336 domain-containing protein [Rhizobiales bacterium]|nr:DUF2336 domain-containing protein [Hyphomicrobiales bacterium]NRB13609.1 DUF2336 domain-containing protein [Hyphomicrobiales bacterium]